MGLLLTATRLRREDADGVRIASQPIELNYELVSVTRLSPPSLYSISVPRASRRDVSNCKSNGVES